MEDEQYTIKINEIAWDILRLLTQTGNSPEGIDNDISMARMVLSKRVSKFVPSDDK